MVVCLKAPIHPQALDTTGTLWSFTETRGVSGRVGNAHDTEKAVEYNVAHKKVIPWQLLTVFSMLTWDPTMQCFWSVWHKTTDNSVERELLHPSFKQPHALLLLFWHIFVWRTCFPWSRSKQNKCNFQEIWSHEEQPIKATVCNDTLSIRVYFFVEQLAGICFQTV